MAKEQRSVVKKRNGQKSGKRVDQTQVIALAIIVILVISIFIILENPKTLSLGTITGFTTTEYKTPVGGTVTIKYRIDTWNERQGDYRLPDLNWYQYNYNLYNLDTGNLVARGTSWRLAHYIDDSITLKMNKEGTFRYKLQETVDFLLESRTVNGTTKDFIIVVGSGINPTPIPTGTGGTVTVISEPMEEATVVTTPPPPITFNPIDSGVGAPTPDAIRVIPTETPVRTVSTPVITPLTTQPMVTEDTDLTFVPAAETSTTPKKEIPGFEAVLVLTSLYILVRGRK